MLHVILTILKIILWILLAILGVVLLLILLVLFSPIRYQADVKYHGNAVVNAKISFLIATVRIFFEQETKKFDYTIRLAGIKLKPGKEKKPKKHRKSDKNKDKASSTVDVKTIEQQSIVPETKLDMDALSPGGVIHKDTIGNSVTDSSLEDFEDVSGLDDFDLFDGDLDKDVPKEQQTLLGRIKAFFIGLKNKLIGLKAKLEKFSPENIEQKFESKIGKLKKNYNKFKRFWNLKCTVKTRNYLKKYLVSLVKHIGPRKVKGYVRYGFGDPCKTGQVTGYLSLLPFVYSKKFSLEPDFYEKIIDTELLIKGKIRIGYILRIVLNINIWRTILVARKIFKGKKNKEV